jgi:hypothetical protein
MQKFLNHFGGPQQMNKLRRSCAVVALSLTLTASAFAGIIHSPGKSDPPPPPSEETSISTTIATDAILTIVSLIN